MGNCPRELKQSGLEEEKARGADVQGCGVGEKVHLVCSSKNSAKTKWWVESTRGIGLRKIPTNN